MSAVVKSKGGVIGKPPTPSSILLTLWAVLAFQLYVPQGPSKEASANTTPYWRKGTTATCSVPGNKGAGPVRPPLASSRRIAPLVNKRSCSSALGSEARHRKNREDSEREEWGREKPYSFRAS
ncbi:unnamed protein product [Pleuronectes platessa]|uniref:Uncharacterized protein n=1 Tax=Pleuronectes platessa TaxID=8262 RepID=A0A9N7U0X8_PLEPL|nr:unnamed protein product [Pleuronectes platessa]